MRDRCGARAALSPRRMRPGPNGAVTSRFGNSVARAGETAAPADASGRATLVAPGAFLPHGAISSASRVGPGGGLWG